MHTHTHECRHTRAHTHECTHTHTLPIPTLSPLDRVTKEEVAITASAHGSVEGKDAVNMKALHITITQHTHECTHTCMHAHTHTHTNARMHARTHATQHNTQTPNCGELEIQTK